MSGGVQGGFARKVPISGLKAPQGRLRACYQHLGAITSVPYKIQCGQKVIRCKGKNESGFKKTAGHKKRPRNGAFYFKFVTGWLPVYDHQPPTRRTKMVPAGLLLTFCTVLVAWLKITVSTPKVSTTATRARICLLTSICDSAS